MTKNDFFKAENNEFKNLLTPTCTDLKIVRKSKLHDACRDYNLRIMDGASFLSDRELHTFTK